MDCWPRLVEGVYSVYTCSLYIECTDGCFCTICTADCIITRFLHKLLCVYTSSLCIACTDVSEGARGSCSSASIRCVRGVQSVIHQLMFIVYQECEHCVHMFSMCYAYRWLSKCQIFLIFLYGLYRRLYPSQSSLYFGLSVQNVHKLPSFILYSRSYRSKSSLCAFVPMCTVCTLCTVVIPIVMVIQYLLFVLFFSSFLSFSSISQVILTSPHFSILKFQSLAVSLFPFLGLPLKNC